jgi:uncharacterized membrane protein (UPF0127 family)
MPCSGDRSCPGYLRCEERACAVPPAITGQVRADTPRVVFDLGDGSTATVRLEICDEPFERQRGMMFRNRFATGWGMLFLFDTEEVHRFWMKNTYLSLDMVFLGADGKVRGIVQGAKPLDLTGRGIREPSLDVLELPSGEARKLGIRRGTPYRYLAVVRPGPTGR